MTKASNRKYYYTLAVCEDGQWSPQFGDYSKATVKDEMQDYPAKNRHKQILMTWDDQDSINSAIAELNA